MHGESPRGCCAFGTSRGDDLKNRSKLQIISLIILGCWPRVCSVKCADKSVVASWE